MPSDCSKFQLPRAITTGSWMVDSGANLSVVSRSVADKLGVKPSTRSETAQGVTGLSVSIRTAVIPRSASGQYLSATWLYLSSRTSDLSFPKFDYRVDGCLGLPVLVALGRVTFYHDGRIRFGPGEKARDKGMGSTTSS